MTILTIKKMGIAGSILIYRIQERHISGRTSEDCMSIRQQKWKKAREKMVKKYCDICGRPIDEAYNKNTMRAVVGYNVVNDSLFPVTREFNDVCEDCYLAIGKAVENEVKRLILKSEAKREEQSDSFWAHVKWGLRGDLKDPRDDLEGND